MLARLRLSTDMRRFIFAYLIIVVLLMALIGNFSYREFFVHRKIPELAEQDVEPESKKTESGFFGGVKKFGPLILGGEIPYGEDGTTFAPIRSIPKSKFYVNIVNDDSWATFEGCGKNGEYVRALGGWLQCENLYQPTIKDLFGFTPTLEAAGVISIVVIADSKSRIVGIYPKATIDDLMSILLLHQDLADFSLREGM